MGAFQLLLILEFYNAFDEIFVFVVFFLNSEFCSDLIWSVLQTDRCIVGSFLEVALKIFVGLL